MQSTNSRINRNELTRHLALGMVGFGLMFSPTARAGSAATIEAANLKPEVLFIDLVNTSSVRGITLAVTNDLGRVEWEGQPAAEPCNGSLGLVKFDTNVVQQGLPMLVAINHYDGGVDEKVKWDRFDEKNAAWWRNNRYIGGVQGFLHRPDPKDFYSSVRAPNALELGWRWWTTFTYANATLFPQTPKQANFSCTSKYPRWILVLPLNDERIKAMNGIREKVLAMMADYSRLAIAETGLQDIKGRLEQALQYQAAGETNSALTEVFGKVKAGAGQARLDMNALNMEVVRVNDEAYLGMFDGKPKHLQQLEAFHKKTFGFLERYRALTAQAEGCLSGQAAAQCAQYGLKPVELQSPPRLAPDHIVTPADLRTRFLVGFCTGYKGNSYAYLPQSAIDAISKDQGIDFTYEYSQLNHVNPKEDGSYDFSELDERLGQSRGIRSLLEMSEVRLPPWAWKKFLGDKPEIQHGSRAVANDAYGAGDVDYYRVKGADGQWDGIIRGNDFTPDAEVWSETILRFTCDMFRAVGEHYRDNPIIMRYWGGTESGALQARSYGFVFDAALPYYRAYLKKKFGDIGKLNAAFGSAYKSFDEIRLPDIAPATLLGEEYGYKTDKRMVRQTPEVYEYTQLCIERVKQVRAAHALALRQGDPNHAIGECQSSMYGQNHIDTYRVACDTPFDTFMAGDSDTRTVRYQYALNHYNPKPIWTYEPYEQSGWTAPDGKGGYRDEETRRRRFAANLWAWFLWGHQGLPCFNQCGKGSVWVRDVRLPDIMLAPKVQANPSVNLAAGCAGMLTPVFNRLEGVLLSAPVVEPRIGLLESSTMNTVLWPPNSNFGDVGGINGRLESERRHFFIVPETAMVDGVEKLDGYRLVMAAYATHLRPEAREVLLKWVKQGGVLICSGPTALYDHYGRSEGGLPEQVFGMKGIEYMGGITEDSKVAKCSGTMAGKEGISLYPNKDFYWRLPAKGLAEGTKVLAELADGTPVVVERAYGKGKVIMTTAAIIGQADLYWQMVMSEINQAQPVPEAASSASDLALQVRENRAGIRYLSVVNRNISAPVEATITVAGEYEHPRDLTVGNGWVIPAEMGGGVTQFKLRLGQGMGTFIELGKSRTKLTGLSPEEENATLDLGRYANLLRRAAGGGLNTAEEEKTLKEVEKEYKAGRYAEVRARMAALSQVLYKRWFDSRTEKIKAGSLGNKVNPMASVWAASYAAMAQTLLQEGKPEAAEERMDFAEKTLAAKPEVYPAEVVFPFAPGRLDLGDLASWPKEGWQKVYGDRQAKSGEIGEFILVGSMDGIYLGAKVLSTNVTDKTQSSGLAWRVMDGVVLHFRGLDKTEVLSGEFRSEDTYEITFYADGSVFVWDNLLSCDMKLIRNKVTRVKDGYWVAGFIPGEAVRFWPRPGVNVIIDACLYTYGKHESGYWHGAYGQANTWARVRLGEDKAEDRRLKAEGKTESGKGEGGGTAQLPKNTAEPCLRVEHWMPFETGGIGRADISFDVSETLPNGKKGAILLSNKGPTDEVQLATDVEDVGRKPGLRVWLKGTASGAQIALRVTGMVGYTWYQVVKDESKEWRSVDVVIDKCKQDREALTSEVWDGFRQARPDLNKLVVRFGKPLTSLKVGLVEYLSE